MPALNSLTLLCLAKGLRTFGFGSISVILAIFLLEKGFSTAAVGLIFSATLIEDAIVTTLVSTMAVRLGRRRVLLAASSLVVLCGLLLALTNVQWVIVCAAVFGIVSPAGYEGGPFGPIEQTIISQSEPAHKLTRAFSWYNLTGFAGAALGALFAGCVCDAAKVNHFAFAYQAMFIAYAFGGLVLAAIYLLVKIPDLSHILSKDNSALTVGQNQTEKLSKWQKAFAGMHLHESRGNVIKLSALQGLDAFGGGFVAQSLIAYWFYLRFQAGPEVTGPIFFWANVLAAVSFTAAPLVVGRFGLLRTMVFTHLPCSMALCLIAFMPNAWAAGAVILARSLFSSMDIPVRQAYTMLLVASDERPAAAGITNAARATCQGIAPIFSGLVMSGAGTALGLPFIFAGLIKSAYDIGVYAAFRNVPLHSEVSEATSGNENAQEELIKEEISTA